MDVKYAELKQHATRINAVLQETCDTSHPAPLVQESDGIIALAASCPSALSRTVTTDLGGRELALRLPIPDASNPRFWIVIQEQWEWKTKKSKYKVYFRACGLRLYAGDRSEEAVQFLRLEWVAPTFGDDKIPVYQGTHAGHPHWHVDKSALVGQEAYLRSLEIQTALQVEEFSEAATSISATAQPLLDFSWLQNIHLPARAHWMQLEWDGQHVPGPHQCEPDSLNELANWWAGSLRYVSTELRRASY
jgi:hypothetical protein